MSESHTGLHGRDPYDTIPKHSHFVAEHWEDLSRGICPRCGRTVRWAGDESGWVRDDSLTVVVLTADEVAELLRAYSAPTSDLGSRLRVMEDLNRPFVEQTPSAPGWDGAGSDTPQGDMEANRG